MAAIAQSAAVKTEDVTDADVARGYVIHPSQRDIQPVMRVVDAEVAQTRLGKNYTHNVLRTEKSCAPSRPRCRRTGRNPVFEVDAPAADEVDEDGKFFYTFILHERKAAPRACVHNYKASLRQEMLGSGKRVLFPFHSSPRACHSGCGEQAEA